MDLNDSALESGTRDILQKLPYDVASAIFDYLDFATRVSCTGVCKAWRVFLLQEKDIMWRDISLSLNAKTYSKICKHWLSRVNGQSVRSLTIRIKSGRCDTVLDKLIKARCNKVSSLTIHGDDWWNVWNTPRPAVAIKHWASHLTKFELIGASEIHAVEPGLWDLVFASCTHLTSVIHSCGADPSPVNLNNLPHHIPLRRLFWNCASYLPYTTLLPRCPDLQYLMVNSRSNDETANQFFTTLIGTCPSLVTLDYTEDVTFQPHDQMDITADQTGLQRLNINVRNTSYIPTDTVLDLILANDTSLNDLRLCDYYLDVIWHSLNSLNVQLPLLKTLHSMVAVISDTALESVYQLLQRCPVLSTLVWRANVDERKMLQDLSIHCPNVTQLTLSLPPDIDIQDHDRLIYLQDNSDRGIVRFPTLTHLQLPYAFILDDHFLLNRLAILQKLTSFSVGYSDSNLTAQALIIFLSTKVPHIEVLALTFMPVFDDEAAQILVKTRPLSLRLLKLKSCHHITDAGVQLLLEADINVETSECYGVSEDMISTLPEANDGSPPWDNYIHKW